MKKLIVIGSFRFRCIFDVQLVGIEGTLDDAAA